MASISKSKIQNKTYYNVLQVMILVELSQVGASFIDGFMVSNYLGADSMASIGISSPFYSIVAIFSGLIMTGTQNACTKLLGAGKIKEMNEIFSLSCVISFIISLILTILFTAFSTQIAGLLGARGDSIKLLSGVKDYIFGLGLGCLPMIFCALLSPIVQLDGDEKRTKLALFAIFIGDIVGNFISIKFNMGLFGMGLATSFASFLGMIVLLSHFTKKTIKFHFSIHEIKIKDSFEILKQGLMKSFRRSFNVIRSIFVNNFILFIGFAPSMTAMSVSNNFQNIIDCFGSGIVSTVLLLSGILYGETNKEGLRQLLRTSILQTVLGISLISSLIIVLAPEIANIYVKNNDEVNRLVILAIRCMALNLPLNTFVELITNYNQGTNHFKTANVINLASRLLSVVICVKIMGTIWGIMGVFLAFPVSSLVVILGYYVMICIHNKKLVTSGEDFLRLPAYFEIPKDKKIFSSIKNIEDVMNFSNLLNEVCEKNGLSTNKSNQIKYVAEELLKKIIHHGFGIDNKKHVAEVNFIFNNDDFTLRFKDDCKHFDMKEECEYLYKNSKYNNFKVFEYMRTLNTNNLLIKISN